MLEEMLALGKPYSDEERQYDVWDGPPRTQEDTNRMLATVANDILTGRIPRRGRRKRES